ncbi:hypothetical protein CKAH01_16719 [Colletotrichum kahawae]|uniref:Uncharacterized protein n=1 Tax=Colletotrichum kahawae TaxID=34407 RepID=A0AAD9YF53_COLKA|nr:hypothetical protein CKAH01_16719 [Colletotrichum kahawae]
MRRFIAFVSLFLHFVITVTAQGFPGPRTTSRDADGNEVYSAKVDEKSEEDSNYRVKDFGIHRPTLVYNCHIVPALCKNVRQYLGQDVSTATLHYDGLAARKIRRRKESCPGSWIETPLTGRLAGPVAGQRCPERDQPDWRYQNNGVAHAAVPAVMYVDPKNGETDINRLATMKLELDKADGTLKPTYTKLDAVLSCDEWPAASWIEGGKGATTYCAPIYSRCTPKRKGERTGMALQTEQNWQRGGHAAITIWVTKLSPINAGIGVLDLRDYTIFKFDFKLVDDSESEYGVWVEVNDLKRYCYGPAGAGTNDPVCASQRPGDPVREVLDEDEDENEDEETTDAVSG